MESMRDLAAQVTSGLLRFPEVTVNALGEDEITLDSVLHGKFTLGRSGLAWLACGPQLEVVHALTGERFSAYRFSGSGEHPPVVLVVRDFCWLKRTGLLVGLEDAEGSLLCLYDLSVSRVVKAVAIPGRITGIEPLVSYGGANAGTQHLHQNLRWFFGVAAVVTDVGHVLLVDLCLDDLSCSQSELEASDLEVVNRSPAEIPRLRESVTHQGRHLCLQLSSPTGTAVTALQYVTRTNQLAVGFSDGYLQLWNMKTLKKEYHSQLEGGRVPVYAFTFQEPENDPRNCCYLWAVQSTQDHEGDVVSLHLLQLAFGERKCLASGKILYEGLEYCEERYSQDLNGTAFPLRAQATSTRLLACQTIEKFRHHPDRDDSLNEVASPDTSVSIFSWQVKSYGQGKPSTYIGVFDINRWYHAQMPDSLRAGESLHSCPYLAVWSLDAVTEVASPYPLLDILVHERSFSRGLPYTCPPPEQFFNPTTYNFGKSAPCLSEVVPDSYSRCLMSGLLSSRLVDVQPSSLSLEEQLDAILSTAVETSSLGLITGFVKQWMTGDQPPTSVNLRYILDWAWNKVVITKEELDGICAPLFDSSSNFTDPQTLQLLQHSQRLLGNLSTIFHCMLNEAHELTQKGLIGLINKKMVSGLIAQYTQVVLWFCRTGLLPEGSDDGMLQISRPFYNYSVIKNYYTGRREELQRLSKGKWCSDCLMIDGLVAQFGERLEELWKRDEGGTGQYPPPTLHVIYLLLDVMYSYPNKSGTSVESFPTAFAIPIGLVKLVQGLWLLDHHNHENSLELLLHPSTSRSLWAWQHERVLQTLMCQGQHAVALRYLHTVKPQMTSVSQVKLCFTVLLYNRCMVEAWALLRQHSSELNSEEMLRFLYETCQELGLMKELLKLPLGFSEQETLEKFLQGTGGPQNKELLIVHYLQQANYVPALQLNQTLKMNLVNDRDPKMKDRSNTRNSILDQYGKVLPRVQRKLAAERAKPYHHPSTVLREVSRPQPLSTIAKRSATENVLTRAAFISNVLTKIGEVWVGKDATPESSPLKSPRVPELPLPNTRHSLVDLPEAFVGTPIAMTTRRKSRVLDLVVQPSTKKTPGGFEPQLTPPSTTASEGLSPPSTLRTGFLRSMTKAPELNLLQTPQVVKRARALAASTTMFSSFTPQSILRSSQRPTPVVSPSASPGRSTSPPLRSKESRITFIEETLTADSVKSPIRWGSTMTEKGEISLLSRSSAPSKSALEVRSDSQLEEEQHVTVFSPAQGPPGRDLDASEAGDPDSCTIVRDAVNMEGVPAAARVSMDYDTNQTSKSVDTTLEFHDAPLPEDLMEESSEELHGQWKVGKQEDLKTLEPAFVEVSVPFSANVSEEGPSTSDGATTRKLEAEQLPEKELAEEKVPEEEVAMEHSPKQEFAEEQKEHVAETMEHTAVVSLNDSEELSSAVSEELGTAVQEDSGSEVEIIQEVAGDKSIQGEPILFQESPFGSEYLEPQAAVVLPAVTHEMCLEVNNGAENMEEISLIHDAKGDEEDGHTEPVFTELKPSAAVLIPLEQDKESEVLDGPDLALQEDIDTELPHLEPLEADPAQGVQVEKPNNKETELPPAEDVTKDTGKLGGTSVLGVKKLESQTTQLVLESTEDMEVEPSITTRRTTRQKRTTSFHSAVEVENDMQSEERKVQEQIPSHAPSTPNRTTRSIKRNQDSDVPFTLRRSTRKVTGSSQPQRKEEVTNSEATKTQTPQKATPRKSTRRTRNTTVAMDEDVGNQESSGMQSLAVPVTRAQSARKAKAADIEVHKFSLSTHLEKLSDRPAVVAITPRKSTRKQLESKVEKSKGITPVAEELPLINSSRRPTRSQLWNHLGTLEKERPLLETALEVEPGAQLADAVMARLKDKHVSEGWQKEKASEDVVTEIVHSSRSLTKAVKDEVPPRLPTTLEAPEENEAMQEGASIMEAKLSETHKLEKSKLQRVGRSTRASKAPESDSSPVRDTFIFSPPRTRQRTKRQGDKQAPTYPTVPAVRVKAAGVPSPVPINLISPMASPATAVLSRSQKKREETEGAPQRMQLRRKWLLDTIIPKPVTRRKIP
ncbi:protein ELYS-like [Scleropages formosus]|uniref:Protein ELYS-like n=1 Tax=Scleropages formosus TaxID=113540 RepID=A0A0P7VPG8_SCLFO|nr:protein ELYS-like [Scleropages formosus]